MRYIPVYDKIIPQQFGVRKHPLFFLPSFIIKSNSNKKKIDLSEETQENMINKDKVEINMINSNDDEILRLKKRCIGMSKFLCVHYCFYINKKL